MKARIGVTGLAALLIIITGRPACADEEGVSGDLASGYSWGTYSSASQADDNHSGMSLRLFAGYRFLSRIEAGGTASFGFPQITDSPAGGNAAFDSRTVGLQAGYYLRNDRVVPYVHYSPLAWLTQSSKSRQGLGTVSTDLSYAGVAYGAGLKIFFTERDARNVQVGMNLAYSHEAYSRASITSSLDSTTDGHPAPAFTPTSQAEKGQQSLSGNTYLVGLFIGI